MSLSVSEQVARFAVGLSLDDVPVDVRELTKLFILDGLGAAVRAAEFDFAASVRKAIRRLGDGGECRAIDASLRTSPAWAALLNGTLVHGLDFDDTHLRGVYHATAPALSAALAWAEAGGATGEELLTSVVAGLEVGCRLAAAAPGEFADAGFHTTSVIGTFGAACAAGTLIGLDEGALANALGIAGSQASGILELGSWLKRIHAGWAAHGAIVACYLADEGFTGPRTVFEGDRGVFHGFARRRLQPTDISFEPDADSWQIRNVRLKEFPCCQLLQAYVGAALAIRQLENFDLRQVVAVRCPVDDRIRNSICEPTDDKVSPPSAYQALFSLQYSVALALVNGNVTLDSYHGPLDHPDEVGRIARLVECPRGDSGYPDKLRGEVEVVLSDGERLSWTVADSWGDASRPLTPDDVIQKFARNAIPVRGAAWAARIAALIMDLEHAPSLDPIYETEGH
jgi:2-methylcitrate dehydratase PrpD